MRIPTTCHKGPVKSILKTSTAYPSPCVEHQHRFSQQNPRSTATENDEKESHEKSAWVQRLEKDMADRAQEYEENRTRRLQEEDLAREVDRARRLEEELVYEAKYVADRAQEQECWAQHDEKL